MSTQKPQMWANLTTRGIPEKLLIWSAELQVLELFPPMATAHILFTVKVCEDASMVTGVLGFHFQTVSMLRA